MKALLILLTTLILSLYLAQCHKYDRLSKSDNKAESRTMTDSELDSINFDQDKALAELRKEIEGWENDPSENVYLNIQVLNGVSAEKLLDDMDEKYSQALGVTCVHCHNSQDWSSDKKIAKNISREMTKMVSQINDNILADMEGLGDRTGNVTCNTCHGGQQKPFLDVDGF